MLKKINWDRIFNQYSVIFSPIIILLFILNISTGVLVFDVTARKFGDISDVITFFVLLSYAILSLFQFALFLKLKMKREYFGITFSNIFFSGISILLFFGGLLYLAFGFVIAAPILIVFIIIWIGSFKISIDYIKSNQENVLKNDEVNKLTVRKIFYFIVLLIPVVFIIQMTYSFYSLYYVRSIGAIGVIRVQIQEQMQKNKFKDPTYRRDHEEFMAHSENFYNALVKMNIKPEKKSFDGVAKEYQKEFSNTKKYSPILGEYNKIVFEKEEIYTTNQSKRYRYKMSLYNNEKLLYETDFNSYYIEDNEYYWHLKSNNFWEKVNSKDKKIYYNYSSYNIFADGTIQKSIDGKSISQFLGN